MRPYLVIGMCGVVAGVVGVAAYASDGLGPAIVAGVVGLALGASLAAIGVGRYLGSRTFRLERRVPIPAGAVRDRATWWFGRAPWVLARTETDELVYWRERWPRLGVAIVLLLFGVIPGVIYLLLSRGSQTVTLGIVPTPNGTDLAIMVHPQRGGGRQNAIGFFNSLHEFG